MIVFSSQVGIVVVLCIIAVLVLVAFRRDDVIVISFEMVSREARHFTLQRQINRFFRQKNI